MENNTMWIREDFINRTENYRSGESEWYETISTKMGELFLSMQREYGRCTGKMFVDRLSDGKPHHVGWVFEQRKRYDDCAETFLSETWITFRKGEPEPHCTHCGAVFGSGHGVNVIQ